MNRNSARISKSPLFNSLQRAFRMALAAKKKGISPKEISEMSRYEAWTRRKFLKNTSKAAVITGVAGSSVLSACKKPTVTAPENVQIAIVGAGIAGLNAGYVLKNAGYTAQIYEASTRTGGRMFTAHDIMAPGLTTELGGEFVDSIHEEILNLASEFGLSLLDTSDPAELALIQDTYYFDGQYYSEAEVVTAFLDVADKIESDINQLSDVIQYNSYSAFDNHLDHLSIAEYLESIGATGLIQKILDVGYLTEYGRETGDQSSINLVYLISTDTSAGSLEIFGESDERYKIAGGNQQIPDHLASILSSQIHTDQRLESVIKNQGGKIELNFIQSNGSAKMIVADRAILTVPFTILRDVHFSGFLPDVKENAIQNLGYGTNAKLMLGFNSRVWRSQNYTGYLFTDNGAQTGWDNSQLQAGTAGGYTVFSGGDIGVNMGIGSEADQQAIFLPKLDQIFPGCSAQYNGNVSRMHWPTNEYTKGSYACYRPGQFTTICGAEFEPVDNLFFAGEHCSINYQGYMNGGAVTGRRAAEKVIASLA